MPKARLRPCSQPGCPELQYEPRCTEHRRANDRHKRQFGSKASEPATAPDGKPQSTPTAPNTATGAPAGDENPTTPQT